MNSLRRGHLAFQKGRCELVWQREQGWQGLSYCSGSRDGRSRGAFSCVEYVCAIADDATGSRAAAFGRDRASREDRAHEFYAVERIADERRFGGKCNGQFAISHGAKFQREHRMAAALATKICGERSGD